MTNNLSIVNAKMCKQSNLVLLIFLLLIPIAQCDDEDYDVDSEDISLRYMFIFGSIIVVSLIRHVTIFYKFPIPYPVFATFLGYLWGLASQYSDWMDTVTKTTATIINYFPLIYIPAFLYTIAMFLDIHVFTKSIYQILIISIPISIICACVTGVAMKQIIDVKWSGTDGVLLGLVFATVYAEGILGWLRESNIHTNYVATLLEGETLISVGVSVSLLNLLLYYLKGHVVYWYQIIMSLLRIIVLGASLGYGFGYLGTLLMKMINYVSGLMLLTLSICFTSYYVGEWIANGGVITTIVTGIMMTRERPSLSKHFEESILDFWKMIITTIHCVFYFFMGVRIPLVLFENNFKMKEYILVCVTYTVSVIVRFLVFLVFWPVLRRIGYGMTFQNMVICVWTGLKNPLCVNLALLLYEIYEDKHKSQLIILHTIGVYLLWLLINASSLPIIFRALGLSEISVSRQGNMNNSMSFLYEARTRTISILKMDRFLSDANWPMVMTSTTLKHPYKKEMQDDYLDEDENEDYFLGYRFTWCPNCEKNIPKKPTTKELRDMKKEAKHRVLKLKKTSYSRQYENGLISTEGLRIMLQAVELAMDVEDGAIELQEILKLFSKQSSFNKYVGNFVKHILKSTEESFKIPKTRWRLICYSIVNHKKYLILSNIMVLLNISLIIVHFLKNEDYSEITYLFLASSLFFSIVWFMEFWVKVLSHSYADIYPNGFLDYFSSHWHKIEFIILILSLLSLILHNATLYTTVPFWHLDIIIIAFLVIRQLHLLTYFELYVKSKKHIITYLTFEMDKSKALAYELGKTYIQGIEEVLENLPHIVDNDEIREMIRKRIEKSKNVVIQKLGLLQIEDPWSVATIKTKIAIRTVLNSIKDDIIELKVAGWADDVEYKHLLNSLDEKYKNINSIQHVPPSSPEVIFRGLAYLGDDEEIIEYLSKNICVKKYNPGDVVVAPETPSKGIYLLITGLFSLQYTPNPKTVQRCKQHGILLSIDYHLNPWTNQESIVEYYVPGTTMGTLSTIADRPYDGMIISETYSEVHFLKRETIINAIKIDEDPVSGLECRIWKCIVLKTALNILLNVPLYRSLTKEKVLNLLERSFVPNLSNYKNFIVSDLIQDIILIEGVVVDYNTKDVHVAPCYIPRTIQKLVLSNSSLVEFEVPVETRLMIIPAQDCDEYEIMYAAEAICEMVDVDSHKRLQHFMVDSSSDSTIDHSKTGARSYRRKINKKRRKGNIKFADSTESKFSKITDG